MNHICHYKHVVCRSQLYWRRLYEVNERFISNKEEMTYTCTLKIEKVKASPSQIILFSFINKVRMTKHFLTSDLWCDVTVLESRPFLFLREKRQNIKQQQQQQQQQQLRH